MGTLVAELVDDAVVEEASEDKAVLNDVLTVLVDPPGVVSVLADTEVDVGVSDRVEALAAEFSVEKLP